MDKIIYEFETVTGNKAILDNGEYKDEFIAWLLSKFSVKIYGNSRQSGGQSCGVVRACQTLECECFDISIKIGTERSYLANKKLAIKAFLGILEQIQ